MVNKIILGYVPKSAELVRRFDAIFFNNAKYVLRFIRYFHKYVNLWFIKPDVSMYCCKILIKVVVC